MTSDYSVKTIHSAEELPDPQAFPAFAVYGPGHEYLATFTRREDAESFCEGLQKKLELSTSRTANSEAIRIIEPTIEPKGM